MSRVVRSSKYRHVFATPFKIEHTYQDLKVYTSAWDVDGIKANRQFFAFAWQSGGGGSLAVLRHQDTGKRGAETPLLAGHKAQIVDWDFNPFNDYIIATSSEDCTVKIWGIPEDGLKETTSTPLMSIDAHSKKLGNIGFHPTAANTLVTTGIDFKLKIWDVENAVAKITMDFPETIFSFSWNYDGSLLATTCKDKNLRVLDPRANNVVAIAPSHQGTKASRAVWLKNKDRIFTVGFSKMSERQYQYWDPRDLSKPIVSVDIDVSAGGIIPYYDEDTCMLYLAGKGDGNIRYFEVVDEAPYLYALSEFKSSTPQRGITFLPKLALDTSSCEVARALKVENNQIIPIMFQVPRKADTFQEDIYPDTQGTEPTVSSDEWFAGAAAPPKLVSMKPGEHTATTAPKMSDFKPKVEYVAPVQLPPKTTDPKALMAQNDEFRARIQALEAENAALKKKLAELGH